MQAHPRPLRLPLSLHRKVIVVHPHVWQSRLQRSTLDNVAVGVSDALARHLVFKRGGAFDTLLLHALDELSDPLVDLVTDVFLRSASASIRCFRPEDFSCSRAGSDSGGVWLTLRLPWM
jgi:hypothetical protein